MTNGSKISMAATWTGCYSYCKTSELSYLRSPARYIFYTLSFFSSAHFKFFHCLNSFKKNIGNKYGPNLEISFILRLK